MARNNEPTRDRDSQIEALRQRLTLLSEASLRISDALDFDAVLQTALDSARSLTGARYGVMTTLDESGKPQDFLASGLSPDEARLLWAIPGGMDFFDYLRTVPGPLRVADFAGHVKALGLPDFLPPAPMSAFLSVPIRRGGDEAGRIHIAHAEPGREFTREDEETLTLFAAQTAVVIANARRRREEQRAKASLETLVDTTPVGVAVFDARTGAPASFNREMARIVDGLRDADQPPGQLLEVMTCRRANGREHSLKEWPLAESLAEGETVRAEEIVLSVPDGRSVSALLNATPIRSEDGEVESFVFTLQDLTPLEEIERLRAGFLGMVSHELRTPLTSIKGAAGTMQDAADDLAPAELRQFLRIIVDQADSMRELIDDLLDVARIQSGSLSVSPEPADVAQLIDRARNTFLTGGGGDRLTITIEPNLPVAMVDRRRIVQVIGNLLANAARHSPEASPIRVNACKEGVLIAVSVADEGRGIPADQLPRLFRSFSEDPAGEGRGRNAGLGLSICKGIVEAHGGRIRAESEGAGLGARFTFTIPAADAAASVSASSPVFASVRQGGGQGVPILVVDDDPQMLLYVRRALANAGYEPVAAADPEDALRLMNEVRPQLALLDMMLPGEQNGIDLMMSISAVAETPVIFLSAYSQDDVISRAFEAGAADYIVKPFSPTELTARVKAALRRKEESYRVGVPEPYVHEGLVVDYAERSVTLHGVHVHLTATEYNLLFELSVNAGRAMTHEQLLTRVWRFGKPGDMRGLRTLMKRLRSKLNDDAIHPTFIASESRVGYRMTKPKPPTPLC